ncbi:hypothetical protein DI005_27145 [Prauserella sp. PE36]|uniref:DUF2017 domain-containing protein n=1 Tax=Prauserella endophytica TaxID=1592324 RepID=A0ABY2RWC4_9PSEU|nr:MULTISPECIES: hypothetical protein [Prauserella]PXY20451.1 hypothetical protein BAY59_31995 [Prauserella coralliicola]RBM15962.1 hypothetical protein DI005_27145 [Prauserella sp. PE36]TKG63142.1 hypothetical protein FCN18_30715 [Prauserella endophytica]
MSAGGLGVHGLTGRLLTVARLGDLDALTALLTQLLGRGAPHRHLYDLVLRELVAIVVRELRERAEPDGDGEGVFVVDVFDDEDATVPIDEVQPALRAVLRAVLASLNEDHADAGFQLGLVADDPDPLARLDAALHVLLWANVLSGGSD